MLKHEQPEQKTTIAYIRAAYPKTLFTIAPNGFKLPMGLARQLQAMGYSAGTPDILIFEPKGCYHGLFIEIKRRNIKGQPKGKLSDYQVFWLKALNERGYQAVCCHGFDEAKIAIDNYFNTYK